MREVAALAPFRGPHSNTWTVQAGSSAAAETRPAPHPQARPRPPPLQLSGVGVEGAARIPSLEAHLPGPGDKVLAQPPPPHTTQTPTSHCSMLASWRMVTNHHTRKTQRGKQYVVCVRGFRAPRARDRRHLIRSYKARRRQSVHQLIWTNLLAKRTRIC